MELCVIYDVFCSFLSIIDVLKIITITAQCWAAAKLTRGIYGYTLITETFWIQAVVNVSEIVFLARTFQKRYVKTDFMLQKATTWLFIIVKTSHLSRRRNTGST